MVREKLSVFGLGKLGCTMLACFAHKGWQVIGVDILEKNVDAVKNGRSPIDEALVEEMISNNIDNISATKDSSYAINNSDISFVIVPTPSLDNGSFSTKYVEAVVAEIGSILRTKEAYHLVVVTSTVLPGDMEYIVKLLEKTSGKEMGKDSFGVCYNPDFIALGSIAKDFLNPDMILIGESDCSAGNILVSIHKSLVDNSPKIHRMNFYNAELTKIALNSFCTLKITFANTLAEICEKLPGGDVDQVTSALGDDSRIGHKYIKGALSFGGPCFPRDNRAFAYSADKYGVSTPLARITDELNDYHKWERIPYIILKVLENKGVNKIAVLGLTYKSDTPVVEESASLAIIRVLLDHEVEVSVYDPKGMPECKKEMPESQGLKYCCSIEECLEDTLVCLVATPWIEFKNLKADDFKKNNSNSIIIDVWNIYDFCDNDVFLIKLGLSNNKQ